MFIQVNLATVLAEIENIYPYFSNELIYISPPVFRKEDIIYSKLKISVGKTGSFPATLITCKNSLYF